MEKTQERRSQLQCTLHPLGYLQQYKYVVVCAWYKGAWLLSKHKKRSTWETQGGHIEPGETPLQAACRELYEESGVRDAELYPVCDYYGYDSLSHANGMVFLAVIRQMGPLPESEMQETALFASLPQALTYPKVSPRLFEEAEKLLRTLSEERSMNKELLEARLSELPLYIYDHIDPAELEFNGRIRWICENECSMYGKSWACPPGVGTVAACREKCMAYQNCLLISTITEVSDIADLEETLSTRPEHEAVTEQVAEIMKELGVRSYVLSTEACAICEACAILEGKPCRFPEKMHPCVESHGINVVPILENRGLEFQFGANVVTWISLLFY